MPLPHALPYALRSLAHRNVRLFFAGQAVSLVGSWMQGVAMSWLVYRLTRSAEMLGLITFLSQVPVLLLSPWAGSLADRLPRRRIVQATQANALVQATLLATLTFGGRVQPWHLLALAVMLGLTYAFEIPARHALLADLSGGDSPNAVALSSSIVNSARVLGPSLAGVVVARVGEAWCFALNAVSFLATRTALQCMRLPTHAPPAGRMATWHHLGEGLAFARDTAWVRGCCGSRSPQAPPPAARAPPHAAPGRGRGAAGGTALPPPARRGPGPHPPRGSPGRPGPRGRTRRWGAPCALTTAR